MDLSAASPDPVKWYDGIGGNLIFNGSLFTTPVLNASTTYYVRAGVLCPSALVSVQAIIDPVAADPVVSNAERCGPGSVTLNASASNNIKWFDFPGGSMLGTGSSYHSPVLTADATYYVRAGDDCPGNYVPVQVSIHALPVPNLGNDTMINSGSLLVLDPGQGFVSYVWSDGSTASTLSVINEGLYSVTVTDDNSCEGIDSIDVIINLNTGIFSRNDLDQLEVFPNPARTDVNVRLANRGIGELRLIDISGRILKQINVNEKDQIINVGLQGLASGLYRIQFQSIDVLMNRTIVIE
jgi:hypothetical protein